MNVLKVQIGRDELLSLPEADYSFFLALGHVTNEVNALTRLAYWAAGAPSRNNEANEHGSLAHEIMLITLLAGKLNEARELLRKSFFSGLSRKYVPDLDQEAARALKSFEQYFQSPTNYARLIRDNFAFHYGADRVGAALAATSGDLFVYLARNDAPNNLFYFSEVVVAQAMTSLLGLEAETDPADKIVAELFTVAALLAQLSDGIMQAIIARSGKELRVADPQEISLDNLQAFEEVALPWFTDTSSLIK